MPNLWVPVTRGTGSVEYRLINASSVHPPAVSVQHMPVNGLHTCDWVRTAQHTMINTARAAWSSFAVASQQLLVVCMRLVRARKHQNL